MVWRAEAAGKAFGALRKCVFGSTSVSFAAKKAVYETLVLSIMLYGSESWCLPEHLLQQLRVLHARCLRSMCRVTRKHTWDHHISTEELMSRTGLDSADFYVAQRQLRWLGHVARMDFHRLPRRMLSAWTPHKRPIGAPRLTYGRSMAKAMAVFDLEPSTWHVLAADRAAWRGMLRVGTAPPDFRTPPPPPVPMPISHFLVRPRRVAATATMTAITSSLAALSLSTRSGELRGDDD